MLNGVVEVEDVYCDARRVVAVRVYLGVVLTQRVLSNIKW